MPRSCRSSDVRAASTPYPKHAIGGGPAAGVLLPGGGECGAAGCHKPGRYAVSVDESERIEDDVRTILVVGGGYAGFYAAWRLEKKLRGDEARIVVVDPRPYMTYQPFLPEVLAGSVESRHAAVS